MNRLTERIKNGKLILKKQFPTMQDTLDVLMDRLELYEDTGIEPEEVEKLHDENISIKKWNACEKELFEKYQADSEKLIEVEAELEEFHNSEEQGLLVKLPCKVGDTIYGIILNELKEYRVSAINIGLRKHGNSCVVLANNYRNAVADFELIDFGKTVFLTKEEAEKALEDI